MQYVSASAAKTNGKKQKMAKTTKGICSGLILSWLIKFWTAILILLKKSLVLFPNTAPKITEKRREPFSCSIYNIAENA